MPLMDKMLTLPNNFPPNTCFMQDACCFGNQTHDFVSDTKRYDQAPIIMSKVIADSKDATLFLN